MKKFLLTLSTLLATFNTFAQNGTPDTDLGAHFLLTGGLTYGGDEIAKIKYDNGDNVNIHAGGLILIGAGGTYRFDNNWEAQVSINYQFDQANAKNGDATFDRFPLDLLGFYRTGPHRFGGGITYHMNPKYKSSFDFSGGKQHVSFDDAMGAVIEYDYFLSDSVSLGARYVSIKYKSSDLSGDLDGSYGGIFMNCYF